jgi:hypothetical protein
MQLNGTKFRLILNPAPNRLPSMAAHAMFKRRFSVSYHHLRQPQRRLVSPSSIYLMELTLNRNARMSMKQMRWTRSCLLASLVTLPAALGQHSQAICNISSLSWVCLSFIFMRSLSIDVQGSLSTLSARVLAMSRATCRARATRVSRQADHQSIQIKY